MCLIEKFFIFDLASAAVILENNCPRKKRVGKEIGTFSGRNNGNGLGKTDPKSFFLGWMGAAGAFVTVITSIISIGNIDVYLANSSIFDGWDKDDAREVVESFQGTYIAFSVIHLMACILLVAGAVKRNRLLLIPWLIENGINLLFSSITILFFTFLLMSHTESIVAAVFIFLFGVLLLSFFTYCWTSVYSLYVYLREGEMVPLMGTNSPFSYTYVRIA